MSAMQKFAWFNLAVIASTVAVIVVCFPFLGRGALGGSGFLGLLGFGALFFRKKAGKVLMDERDQLIQLRSAILSYSVFWVIYCLSGTIFPYLGFRSEGAAPLWC